MGLHCTVLVRRRARIQDRWESFERGVSSVEWREVFEMKSVWFQKCVTDSFAAVQNFSVGRAELECKAVLLRDTFHKYNGRMLKN